MEDKFELQPELTGVALAYRNKNLIADEIFPEVDVDRKSFQYRSYNKAAFLTVPDTEIGEKGAANEAILESILLTETCQDHALKEKIPVSRIEEAQAAGKGDNLMSTVTMQLTDLMKLSREVKIARKLATVSNYGSNTKTYGTNEKFTNDEYNAHKALTTAMDNVFYQPNVLVTSRKAFSALCQNPYVVSAVNSSDVKAGVASIEGLKRTYGFEKILVGEGYVNTANKNQTPHFESCWGNNIILMHINPVANTDYGMTFGYKAVKDKLQVGTYFEPDAGTKGCQVLRTFETYIDLLTCPECGYLMKDVV